MNKVLLILYSSLLKMLNKTTYLVLAAWAIGAFASFSVAQEIGIGQWRDHLSYNKGVAVAEGGGMVYCATAGGFFSFNKLDNSIERLSKINGFSSTGVNALGYNKYNNVLVIAYKNSNIDLLVKGKIINMPDIKQKAIIGNKSINGIYFKDQYAYLACGFGIVVLDTERKEIKETYQFGAGGAPINIMAVTTDATTIYAATDQGIYTASLANPNLLDYSSWVKISGLANGTYNTIEIFNGNIITNHSTDRKSVV